MRIGRGARFLLFASAVVPGTADTDCAGAWGEWGECSATCGGGKQQRAFTVTSPQVGSGQACPASPEQQDCNKDKKCACSTSAPAGVCAAAGESCVNGACEGPKPPITYSATTPPPVEAAAAKAQVAPLSVTRDVNKDYVIEVAEADALYKKLFKDYHNYEKPADAVAGRQGFYCPTYEVLLDTATGWPAGCDGLTEVMDQSVDTAAKCQALCAKDMTCAVWQWVGEKDTPPNPKCQYGQQTGICSNSQGLNISAGQRIQHGGSYVAENLTGVQIMGLEFHPENSAFPQTQEAKIERCRNICKSDIECAVWQYGAALGNVTKYAGCWIENRRAGHLEGVLRIYSDDAKAMIAGERLGRTCHGFDSIPAPGAPPGDHTWMWVMGVLALVAGLAVAFYLAVHKKSPPKKSRAIKATPAKVKEVEEPSEATVPLFNLQPTVLLPVQTQPAYQMQQVVMQQPPMVQQPMMASVGSFVYQPVSPYQTQ